MWAATATSWIVFSGTATTSLGMSGSRRRMASAASSRRSRRGAPPRPMSRPVEQQQAIVQSGGYPEHRSHTKGAEPEGMETGTSGDIPMVFVAAERASVVAVYDVSDVTAPRLHQLLPSGISPECLVAIPQRNLIATANELDGREDGAAASHIMIYEWQDAPAAYPMSTSKGADSLIGCGALSGLVGRCGQARHPLRSVRRRLCDAARDLHHRRHPDPRLIRPNQPFKQVNELDGQVASSCPTYSRTSHSCASFAGIRMAINGAARASTAPPSDLARSNWWI